MSMSMFFNYHVLKLSEIFKTIGFIFMRMEYLLIALLFNTIILMFHDVLFPL